MTQIETVEKIIENSQIDAQYQAKISQLKQELNDLNDQNAQAKTGQDYRHVRRSWTKLSQNLATLNKEITSKNSFSIVFTGELIITQIFYLFYRCYELKGSIKFQRFCDTYRVDIMQSRNVRNWVLRSLMVFMVIKWMTFNEFILSSSPNFSLPWEANSIRSID